jgi:hypothetical protein
VTFQDLVSQTVGGASTNPMQVGLGVTTGAISPVFSQGAIENTREATNVAIRGGGFFVVADDDGSYAYTRAGNFSFDKDGKLVTPDGHFVQGYTGIDPATGAVITSGQPDEASRDMLRVVASRPDTRTHLVIAADTPVSTMRKVLERFECARPARLALTKVDEAESLAPIVSLLRERQVPISYLGIGRRVPDDLQIATARALASWVTGDGAAHGAVA